MEKSEKSPYDFSDSDNELNDQEVRKRFMLPPSQAGSKAIRVGKTKFLISNWVGTNYQALIPRMEI